jgi:hypothetical protein
VLNEATGGKRRLVLLLQRDEIDQDKNAPVKVSICKKSIATALYLRIPDLEHVVIGD